MKTTKFILFCLSAIAFASCTTVRYTQNTIAITPKKDIVVNKIGDDIVHFNLTSLSNSFNFTFDSIFPIVTYQTAGNFSNWQKHTASEPEYSRMLPEKSHTDWDRTVKKLVRKYSKRFDELIFTIPDAVIAYTEDYSDIPHLKPYPDLLFSDVKYPEFPRYYDESLATFDQDVMNNAYHNRIFRTIKKNYARNAVVAIDRIYLRDTKKVLCLMYLCSGDITYLRDADENLYYCSNHCIKWFNPIKNITMAIEYLYRHCDAISVSAFKSINQI